MTDGRVDVATIGETMAMFTPSSSVPLDAAEHLVLRVGGAESNVAMHLAALGFTVRWVSRLGDDPLGRRILRELRESGVDVAAVHLDLAARTGLYLKDPAPSGTTVHYYRDGSAATRMDAGLLDDAVDGARVLHLSGITAALSSSCHALLHAAVVERRLPGTLVSFDVNHRPGLWSAAQAAPVLADLADASDLVFVGLDEAERLWGCTTPDAVRERLPSPTTVVVKHGDVAAHAIMREGATSVAALDVEVVEPVGAGDAFAAGYLAGLLEGMDATACLRWGHLLAAQILQVMGDQATLPPRSWFEERVGLPAAAWDRLDVSADAPGT